MNAKTYGLVDVLENIRRMANLIEVKPGIRKNHELIVAINQNIDALEEAAGRMQIKEAQAHEPDDEQGQDVQRRVDVGAADEQRRGDDGDGGRAGAV